MNLKLWKKTNNEEKGLEGKITRFINKAEELVNENYSLGIRFLKQANDMYNKLGYKFEVEIKLNQVCFKYIDRFYSLRESVN